MPFRDVGTAARTQQSAKFPDPSEVASTRRDALEPKKKGSEPGTRTLGLARLPLDRGAILFPALVIRTLMQALAILTTGNCFAQQHSPSSMAGEPPVAAQKSQAEAGETVVKRLPFAQWIETQWPAAEAMGLSRTTFVRLTRDLKPDFSLPDLDLPGSFSGATQAEFARLPSDYLSENSLARLAAQGRELAKVHAQLLTAINQRFGTPGPIILAVWGRETDYGSYHLPHNAIRVLATQAYAGRRSEFFRNEFLLALRLVQEGHVKVEDMHSSWAGAMGPTQFLPSDFYKFAVDFDGDGRRDIWNSIPDSLASAAKQLVDYGWQAGKPWGFEVASAKSPDCTEAVPSVQRPIERWIADGFSPIHANAVQPWLGEDSSLVMPAGTFGPSFLTMRNYEALKSYNASDLYALFVGNLADRIAGGEPFQGRWQQVVPTHARDVQEMQRHLTSFGLYHDKIDGKAGPRTRVAIGNYQKQAGLDLNCWPTLGVLAHMRSANRK
jgi:lytic murein transglycosylase